MLENPKLLSSSKDEILGQTLELRQLDLTGTLTW